MTNIYRASLDTRHFEFLAFGNSADAARVALRKTLEAHQRQYKLNGDWYEPADIEVRPFELGKGYRDRELFPK